MTEREAIANIEYARSWLGSESDFSDEALDMAIAALEKQIPRTVRTQFDRWNNYFLHFCPVCGGLAREYEYCSDCGQKLSYEEEQE